MALLIGSRTRLATLACWYLVSSLQVRQPLVYIAGDSILRLLLFRGLFLPLGARFSVDASRGRVRPRANHHLSGATAALLMQVCVIYWATGLQKSGPLWRSGQAVSYALQADEWATPLGAGCAMRRGCSRHRWVTRWQPLCAGWHSSIVPSGMKPLASRGGRSARDCGERATVGARSTGPPCGAHAGRGRLPGRKDPT